MGDLSLYLQRHIHCLLAETLAERYSARPFEVDRRTSNELMLVEHSEFCV